MAECLHSHSRPLRIGAAFLIALSASAKPQENNKLQMPGPSDPQTQISRTPEHLDHLPVPGQDCLSVRDDSLKVLKGIQAESFTDRATASKLAAIYFEHRFGACGGISIPTETATEWRFPAFVGINPSPVEPIFINKVSGKISCPPHEGFESPSALLKHLLTNHSCSELSRHESQSGSAWPNPGPTPKWQSQ